MTNQTAQLFACPADELMTMDPRHACFINKLIKHDAYHDLYSRTYVTFGTLRWAASSLISIMAAQR